MFVGELGQGTLCDGNHKKTNHLIVHIIVIINISRFNGLFEITEIVCSKTRPSIHLKQEKIKCAISTPLSRHDSSKLGNSVGTKIKVIYSQL